MEDSRHFQISIFDQACAARDSLMGNFSPIRFLYSTVHCVVWCVCVCAYKMQCCTKQRWWILTWWTYLHTVKRSPKTLESFLCTLLSQMIHDSDPSQPIGTLAWTGQCHWFPIPSWHSEDLSTIPLRHVLGQRVSHTALFSGVHWRPWVIVFSLYVWV